MIAVADPLDALREAMGEISAAMAPRAVTQQEAVDAVNASTIVHGRDFEIIHSAIRRVAREAGGVVDPNLVREELTDSNGDLTVYPRTIGAQYSGLKSLKVLQQVGWTTSTDRRGRNAGKPARMYRVIDEDWLAGNTTDVPTDTGGLRIVDGSGAIFELDGDS